MDERTPGARPPEYIRIMALQLVEDLMIQGYGPQRILAECVERGYTDSAETVRDWRQAVQRRWAVEELDERPARKEGWRIRIMDRIRRLEVKASAATSQLAAAAMESEITKLYKLGILVDGAHAPIVHRHESASGVPVEAMSPIERDREIDQLLEKKRQAEAERKHKREPGLLS
jgi:hypothetical protein